MRPDCSGGLKAKNGSDRLDRLHFRWSCRGLRTDSARVRALHLCTASVSFARLIQRFHGGIRVIEELLKHPGVPVLTFLLGLIVGHWLALGRDRRKERNEASAPVREWFLREVEEPDPYSKRPSLAQRDAFVQCLSAREQRAFGDAFIALDHAHACERQQDNVGQVSYRDGDRVRRAAKECLRFTGRV